MQTNLADTAPTKVTEHGFAIIHRGGEICRSNLPGAYKGVFFILQDLYFLTSGQFVQVKRGLLNCLKGTEREVMGRVLAMKDRKASREKMAEI